jgi:hypothetical protein
MQYEVAVSLINFERSHMEWLCPRVRRVESTSTAGAESVARRRNPLNEAFESAVLQFVDQG